MDQARLMPGKQSIAEVDKVLAALKRLSSKKIRHDMSARYGIYVDKAWGVRMSGMQEIAKGIGRNHELAQALWDTGWYEARTVAALIDDPGRVTPVQMDRWCKDFDNWGIVDTVCFKLFDQVPHALQKVPQWAKRRDEFQKRAAFALLACVALHDRKTADAAFTKCLPLIEKAATDERNFVKKGISWALRAIGMRSAALNKQCTALADQLVASGNSAAKWIGKDALKDLNKRR
jgi:3-methyladenine DNA glycosylase AlkD